MNFIIKKCVKLWVCCLLVGCISNEAVEQALFFPDEYALWFTPGTTNEYVLAYEVDFPLAQADETEKGQIIDNTGIFHEKTFSVSTRPLRIEELEFGLTVYYSSWASRDPALPVLYKSNPWYEGIVTNREDNIVSLHNGNQVDISWLRISDSK